MGTKLNIEQLFTSKLEGLEQAPSPSVWKHTNRIVRRKQFLRFNYRRFNVYYTAGLIILGTVLIYAFISVGTQGEQTPGTSTSETPDQHKSEIPVLSQDQINNEIDGQLKDPSFEDRNQSDTHSSDRNDSEQGAEVTLKDGIMQQNNPNASAEISEIHEDIQTDTPVATLVPYFTPSVYEGCAPLTVSFVNSSINATGFSWNFGIPYHDSNSDTPVVTYPSPGTYTITMTAMDQNGMRKSHAETIIVHPKPEAAFEIDQGSIYNYSIDASEFRWHLISGNIGIKDPSQTQPFSTNFQPPLSRALENENAKTLTEPTLLLVVKNSFGCMDTASMVLPEGNDPQLAFPTAFSPNPNGSIGGYYNPNDPDNQVFHPNFEEVPESYHLRIYNKTGTLVFETTDIYVGWDGYYQEAPVPRGVYIYYCTGAWKSGNPYQYRGDITILWNDQ